MAWARFDDGFISHPKVAPRSPAAFRLCVTAIVECSRCLTDGAIARDLPASWPAAPRGRALAAAIAELVMAKLWDVTTSGWTVHDYLDWNPSAAEVRAKRELRSEIGRNGGKRSAEAKANAKQTVDQTVKQKLEQIPSNGQANVQANFNPVPVPVPQSAAADSDAGAREPSGRLTTYGISAEWHAAVRLPGAGDPMTLHAEANWRPDYETILTVLTQLPEHNHWPAARAVCRWFWLAPDGPIQSGRIKRGSASPAHLAKRISSDLRAANDWWFAQSDASEAAL